jgi:putative oxidoreductase
MTKLPSLTTEQSLAVMRISTSLIMFLHGAARAYLGTVDDFGAFLDSRSFIIGSVIAWGITLFEIIGGPLLALGYFKRVISSVFAFNLVMGIILVHFKNGWFVVGHSLAGMEFSVLLIICFLLVALTDSSKK